MNARHYICVYAGSSNDVNPLFIRQARALGQMCAREGIVPVSGGGNFGLMGAMIDGCVESGGETVGVLPAFMMEKGWNHGSLTSTVVTSTMHQRKYAMQRDAVAAVALPGGVGTFDELMEIVTWRQLGLFKGEVIVVNIGGYFNPMLEMMRNGVDCGFIKQPLDTLFSVVDDADGVMDIVKKLI